MWNKVSTSQSVIAWISIYRAMSAVCLVALAFPIHSAASVRNAVDMRGSFASSSGPQAAGDPVDLDVVEVWIQGGVSPQRAWNRDLSPKGISFQLTPEVEARLRAIGATDEWMAVLRRARYLPPVRPVSAPAQPTERKRRSLTSDELRPLYFGRSARMIPYVSFMQLKETGGSVDGWLLDTSHGVAVLNSTPLPRQSQSYGILFGYSAVALDLEFQAQHDFLGLNLGVRYTPSVYLGTSGFRLAPTVKPFLGIARQTLARFPKESFDTTEPIVDLVNNIWGVDAGVGIAYHWSPGHWVFGEVGYRFASTFSRELRAPGRGDIAEGVPWSKWSARGLTFRFGVGF